MNNEIRLTLVIGTLIILFFICLLGLLTIADLMKANAIIDLVRAGADPLVAKCALSQ